MTDWQPIETAATNEVVLLWYEMADAPVFGHVFEHHDGTKDAASSMARGVKFTHWMPLPKPPNAGTNPPG